MLLLVRKCSTFVEDGLIQRNWCFIYAVWPNPISGTRVFLGFRVSFYLPFPHLYKWPSSIILLIVFHLSVSLFSPLINLCSAKILIFFLSFYSGFCFFCTYNCFWIRDCCAQWWISVVYQRWPLDWGFFGDGKHKPSKKFWARSLSLSLSWLICCDCGSSILPILFCGIWLEVMIEIHKSVNPLI